MNNSKAIKLRFCQNCAANFLAAFTIDKARQLGLEGSFFLDIVEETGFTLSYQATTDQPELQAIESCVDFCHKSQEDKISSRFIFLKLKESHLSICEEKLFQSCFIDTAGSYHPEIIEGFYDLIDSLSWWVSTFSNCHQVYKPDGNCFFPML